MPTFCVKCRSKTNDIDEQLTTTKNNKSMIRSKCEICGNNKCRFVSKKEDIEGGELKPVLWGNWFENKQRKI